MAGQIDTRLIDQIVAEVLEKLRQRVPSAPKPNAHNGALKENYVNLHDPVITEETVRSKNPGNVTIRISAEAILTPSARDYVRSQQISVIRTRQENIVASGKKGIHSKIIAAHAPETVQTLLADVRKNAPSLWSVEMESGVLPVVERVRSIICRGEARQVVVFVKTSHAVSCLMNRNPQCRSAVVRHAEDVRKARVECGANVICVDLQQPTFIGLRKILEASVKTIDQIREPDWS